MKRKWGVLAILLPFPKDSLQLLKPLEKGDKVSLSFLQELTKKASVTFPTSLFRHQRLGISVRAQTSLLACIPPLAVPYQHGGNRVHLLLVSTRLPDHCSLHVGENRGFLSLPFFCLPTEPGLKALFSFEDTPHAVFLHPEGGVASITAGDYLHPQKLKATHRTRSGVNYTIPW